MQRKILGVSVFQQLFWPLQILIIRQIYSYLRCRQTILSAFQHLLVFVSNCFLTICENVEAPSLFKKIHNFFRAVSQQD